MLPPGKTVEVSTIMGGAPIAGWFMLESPKIEWMLWANPLFRKAPYNSLAPYLLGESPKLSQIALFCLISVCHAEEVTQPSECITT